MKQNWFELLRVWIEIGGLEHWSLFTTAYSTFGTARLTQSLPSCFTAHKTFTVTDAARLIPRPKTEHDRGTEIKR
jgi:hypothetical protein